LDFSIGLWIERPADEISIKKPWVSSPFSAISAVFCTGNAGQGGLSLASVVVRSIALESA
jgi:hypothetical protein